MAKKLCRLFLRSNTGIADIKHIEPVNQCNTLGSLLTGSVMPQFVIVIAVYNTYPNL